MTYNGALVRIAAEAERLQVADVVRSALVPGDDVVHLQGPLMLMRAAALAAAPCPGEHPVLHRAADRAAVAGAMGEHLLTPLLAEPVQSLSAQLQQRVALAIAQLLGADEGVEPIAVAGDAVAGEHAAHHPFHPFRVVLDLAHVLPQDPPGDVLRRGRAVAPEQFHEHQGLIDGAHAHPLGDVVPEALVGGGGVLNHGGILAGV